MSTSATFFTDLVNVSQNSGQNCIGIERLLVHTSQYDELFDIFAKRVEMLRFGSVLSASDEGFVSTVDCGAMISNQRFDSLEAMIKEAEDAGATVIGGKRLEHGYLRGGFFFDGTVVGDPIPDSNIAQQERKSSCLIQRQTICSRPPV